MNQDIRLSVAFNNHRKRKRLVRILGFGAEVYLIDLWLKVAVDRPSGHLIGWDEEDIADACGWMKEPRELVDALIESLWLEKDKDGEYAIHDWCEHQPWACSVEDRADKARFSKLAQVNRATYEELKKNGVNAISKADYQKILEPSRTNGKEKRATRRTASVSPAPAPSPSPTPSPSPNVIQKPLPPAGVVDETLSDDLNKKSEFSGCPPKAYHPLFEKFWIEYPPRNGKKGSKRKAFEAWWYAMRRELIDPEPIIAAIIRIRSLYLDYPPDAVTWIHGQQWEDEIHHAPPNKQPVRSSGRLQGSELLAHNTRAAAEFLGVEY